MIIRKATKNELPVILELQKRAFYSEAVFYNDFTIPPLNQSFEEIEQEFTEKQFFVATIDNIIIGSVRFKSIDTTGYIGKLIVSPEHQNKGIGRTLLQEAEKNLQSVSKIELFTGERSLKNIRLYQSLDYTIVRSFPDTEKVTLVLMEKTITSI
jgi:ribosomal protein S18 acetylase RimI-like enzyme